MEIIKSKLSGAAEIKCEPFIDHRGWFTRFFCQEEMFELNQGKSIVQVNSSFTKKKRNNKRTSFSKPSIL